MRNTRNCTIRYISNAGGIGRDILNRQLRSLISEQRSRHYTVWENEENISYLIIKKNNLAALSLLLFHAWLHFVDVFLNCLVRTWFHHAVYRERETSGKISK